MLTGLRPYAQLDSAAPVADALEIHPHLSWLKIWVDIGALFGLTSVIITMIIPQARIWLTMSQDGLLPKFLRRRASALSHPTHLDAHCGFLCTALLGGLLPVDLLAELVSIGTLIAFIVVCISVVVLRYTRPDLHRPFRVPAVGLVAALGIGLCGFMAYSLPNATWWRLLWWSVIGFAIYFFYGYHHSRLRKPETEADRSARVSAAS